MKSFIVALLLFAAIVGTVVTNSIYVNSVCEKISELAAECSEHTARSEKIMQMNKLWTKSKDLLDLSIETAEIETMTEFIASLAAADEAGRDADVEKYCVLISDLCEEFMRHEKISLGSLL